MENNKSNISNTDFYLKYIELVEKGFSDDSHEMGELFNRANHFSDLSDQQSTDQQVHPQGQPRVRFMPHNSGQSTQYSNAYSKNYLGHIVINPDSGNYTLLDSHLNVVDSMYSNPLFSFLTQKHKLRKFKKQLKMDFKLYEKSCRRNRQAPNAEFKKMFKLTKKYLRLCPDADYQILELLRNNITKINPTYANYQAACAEYLYELAQFRDGNPSTLPFDINFCCDKIHSKHVYIANRFDPSPDPVQTFKRIYSRSHNVESEFQSGIRYNARIPNSEFSHVRNVRAPITHDRD